MADKFDKYRKAIADGLLENKQLVGKRREIDVEIRKVHQLVMANINMLPDEERDTFLTALEDAQGPTGLRNAILRVLKQDKYMSPPVVRLELSRIGYDTSHHANPLASIHTTLKRLVDDGEAETKQFTGGTHYKRKLRRVTVEEKV